MEIQIIDTASNNQPFSIIASSLDTVMDLKKIIHSKLKKSLPINRINLFYFLDSKKIDLSLHSCTLDKYPGFKSKTIVYIADAGFTINKHIAILLENLGPIIIQSIIYFQDSAFTPSLTQQFAYFMAFIHYALQLIKGIFLHSSKYNSVSFNNVLMKCILNWLIFGLVCGITIYTETYKSIGRSIIRYGFVMLFFVCEYFAMFYQVIWEQNKFNKKTKTMVGLYNQMICPHFFMEFCAWVSYAIVVGTLPMLIFTCGMMILLCTKSVNKKKSFLSKYENQSNLNNKYAFIPFII